jgi:hypothetical protein
MAHDYDGAETEFRLAAIDGPSEDFLEEFASLSLVDEARLAEAVAIMVSVCKRRERNR